MRIAVIPSEFLPMPPVKGGAVQVLLNHYLRWNEHNSMHSIDVFSPYDAAAFVEAKQYAKSRFVYIDDAKQPSIFSQKVMRWIFRMVGVPYLSPYLKKLKSMLAQDEYDVFLFENTIDYAGKVLPKTGRRVLHLHNDYALNGGKDLCEYSTVIAISDFIRSRVQSASNAEVVVIHNAIDVAQFSPGALNDKMKSGEIREKFNIGDEDVVCIFSGRLVPEKGVTELVSAFIGIDNPKLKLIIMGSKIPGCDVEDGYVRKLKSLAAGAQNRILFTGHVSPTAIHEIYKIADIGLLPSRWEEPFSLSLLEFLSMGIPVIATNSGGIPEVVDDNCAILIDNDDDFVGNLARAISALADCSAKRTEMANMALRRSTMFSLERYCKEMNDVLEG